MQTLSGAVGSAIIALLATALGQFVLKIRPRAGFLGGFVVSYVFAAFGTRLIPAPGWDRLIEGFPLLPALGAVWIPWFWWWKEAESFVPVCQGLVRLARVDGRIQARPERVCLHLGRNLTWDVEAARGETVEILFESRGRSQGPFVHSTSNAHNPGRGHYRASGPSAIDSNPADQVGRWKYTVTWTTVRGDNLILDPEVCIKR